MTKAKPQREYGGDQVDENKAAAICLGLIYLYYTIHVSCVAVASTFDARQPQTTPNSWKSTKRRALRSTVSFAAASDDVAAQHYAQQLLHIGNRQNRTPALHH